MVTGNGDLVIGRLVSFALSRLGLGLWRIVAERTRYMPPDRRRSTYERDGGVYKAEVRDAEVRSAEV